MKIQGPRSIEKPYKPYIFNRQYIGTPQIRVLFNQRVPWSTLINRKIDYHKTWEDAMNFALESVRSRL